MWFRWFLSVFCGLILLHTLEIEAWSGHVCTKYMITYLNESYCHSARYWWWTGKHTCIEWKNRQKSRMYSMQYCCSGWKHNGDQLCTIHTDVMNAVKNGRSNNIPTYPEKKRDMLGKHLSLIRRQATNCGGNRTAQTSATTLTSPNYPNSYGNNLRCNWTIQASMNSRIAIRIMDLDVQQGTLCSYDYLKLNLGSNSVLMTNNICRKNKTDLIYISRSNKADINFVTDSYGTRRGFLLQYQAVQGCGGSLTAQSWSISLNSPNYPNQYSNNLYCHWTIEAGSGYRIAIRITDIDLEENLECSKDYLQMYLGSNPIADTGRMCSRSNINLFFLSKSNEADVIFVTDGSTTKTGFSLQYQRAIMSAQSCGGNGTAQTLVTILASPNYPNSYGNNLRCNWTIQASMNSRIAIRIVDLDVQQGTSCSYDYLKINLGSNSVLMTNNICSKNKTDLIYISRSSKADINFITNSYGTGRGFLLQYQAVQGCGGSLTAQLWSISLNSPNYPNHYSNNLYCYWTIEAVSGYRIAIRITDIDVEENLECSKDYLQMYLGSNPISGTGRMCSRSNINLFFLSRSNEADVIFVTDGSTTKTGFSLQYQRVMSAQSCGGNLTAQTWVTILASPNYPNSYENNLRCNWTIQASMNSRIAIRIVDLDVQQGTSCSYDYLKINLGSNSVLMTNNICSKNKTDLIYISRSNKADINFITDSYGTGRGFLLQYQAVQGCGGSLTAQAWSISLNSPNFPNQYSNNLYCHWTIEAGMNYRIAIRIIDIDVEENLECSKDYLQMYLESNPILETGKICRKNNTNLYFLSRSNETDVIFVTDGSTTKTGFSLQYQRVSLDQCCVGNLMAQTWTTTLTSPNYPYLYGNNLRCNWTIQAPLNSRIALRITDIDVEQISYCSHDYLKINLGSSNVLETERICSKNNTNLIFISKYNKIDISFVTDGSVTKKGFILQYQAVILVQSCGGSLTAQTSTTTLTSPNYPYWYENNLRCNWTIQAPMNYRIAIRIIDMDLEQISSCTRDYLKINMGSNSVLETDRICSIDNTELIFISRSNKAGAIFVTDSYVRRRGFLLQYQAGIWSCEDGSVDMSCHIDWDTPTQNGSSFTNIPCVEKSLDRPETVNWIAAPVVVCVISLFIVGFYCWYRRRRNQSGRKDNRQDLTRPGYDDMETEHSTRATVDKTMKDVRHMRSGCTRENNRDALTRSGHDAMELEHSSRATIDISIAQEEEGRNSINEEEDANQSDVTYQQRHYTQQQETQRLHHVPRNDRYNFTNYGYVEEMLNRAGEARLVEAASSEDNREGLMRSEYQSMEIEHHSEPTIDTAIDQEEGGRNIMDEEQEADQSDFVSLPRRTIEDILSEMRDLINVSGYNTLYIKRSSIWESALEQFRQERFSPADTFRVQFVDDEGNAEGAIDAGGPRREYFQLMMDHLANCSLFEGPSGRKLLSYDVQANKRNEYFYAGMVIGQSMLFNGPVPRFISPLLLDCLILGPENVVGSREDIYDSDWQQLLDEVQTTDCIRDFVLNHNKTMHIAGCLRNEKMENRDQLIQDLINYYLAERTRPAFEKFKHGLKSVGVYNYILTYPDQFRELFSKNEPLTAEKMAAIFTINYTHSQVEYNEEVERKTAEFWEIYLCIVEAGGSPINLEDIMMFATGMKEQPYGQSPKIYFSHPYGGNPASKYPLSSTCSCTLYLPLHDTFEEFKESMDFGILNGNEFGRA